MKMNEIERLAGAMKIHPVTLYRKLKGERGISAGDAKKLESLTGVDRRAWLWPEDFHNPYLSNDGEDVGVEACSHQASNNS